MWCQEGTNPGNGSLLQNLKLKWRTWGKKAATAHSQVWIHVYNMDFLNIKSKFITLILNDLQIKLNSDLQCLSSWFLNFPVAVTSTWTFEDTQSRPRQLLYFLFLCDYSVNIQLFIFAPPNARFALPHVKKTRCVAGQSRAEQSRASLSHPFCSFCTRATAGVHVCWEWINLRPAPRILRQVINIIVSGDHLPK